MYRYNMIQKLSFFISETKKLFQSSLLRPLKMMYGNSFRTYSRHLKMVPYRGKKDLSSAPSTVFGIFQKNNENFIVDKVKRWRTNTRRVSECLSEVQFSFLKSCSINEFLQNLFYNRIGFFFNIVEK